MNSTNDTKIKTSEFLNFIFIASFIFLCISFFTHKWEYQHLTFSVHSPHYNKARWKGRYGKTAFGP